ncbi:hypothetical protein [Arthrobacter sp. H-02-3]|uniref:hypothetical protein n=1 Tax=Arthrobacter sp. H-02-3 TaxID=2703675 RepID=UPI000DD25D4F|nr:hypothetical protein [Arthrobacter sp. H-02-3]PVZ56696.1 hypothetical protein C9424_10815 [Arthrobacter sp. H-02-3]
MNMDSKFSLDVLASADLGLDTYEGPYQDRSDVSVSSFLRTDEGVTVLVDIVSTEPVELPLGVARQLAEALLALLDDLDA